MAESARIVSLLGLQARRKCQGRLSRLVVVYQEPCLTDKIGIEAVDHQVTRCAPLKTEKGVPGDVFRNVITLLIDFCLDPEIGKRLD